MVSTMQLYEKRRQHWIDTHGNNARDAVSELYDILMHLQYKPKDARAKIEQDFASIWNAEYLLQFFPDEAKDSRAQELGKKSGEARRQKAFRKSEQESEKTTDNPTITIGADGSSLPSEPYSKGAPEDREATRPEKQGIKIQELTALLAQKDRTLIDMQEKLKAATSDDGLDEEYIHQLKQKIKGLEEGYTVEADVEVGDKWLPVMVFVRPANKSAKVVVNERKMRQVA